MGDERKSGTAVEVAVIVGATALIVWPMLVLLVMSGC